MRVLGALLGTVVGVGALAGTIWVARYGRSVDSPEGSIDHGAGANSRARSQRPRASKDEKELKPRPPIADKPPFPKAATENRVFDFGSMAVNEQMKHKFSIKNEGQGTLELEVGPCTCKCTVGGLSKKKVPPAESVDVELTWGPKEVTRNFSQQCTIWTSDPDSPEIQFKVRGRVDKKFEVIPEKVWHAGQITDIQDGFTTGRVISSLEWFKISSVESTNPHVTVTFAPLESMALMRMQGKAGYQFMVKADRGMPIGPFRVPVRIHTTLEGNKTVEIDVTGTRSGPILFLPPQGKGIWKAETSTLYMGRIHSDVGAKAELPATLYGMKDKFKVLKTTSDAEYLKVSVKPDPQITEGEQQGVLFVFEVPPGSPSETRVAPNAVHVTLETNHPKLKEIHFEVEFICQ
jgi:Protein of unknown function (DUF1573)